MQEYFLNLKLTMEEVYAALLLHAARQPISEESIKRVLQAAGASVDEARVKALVVSLQGVDIEKVIQETALLPTPAPAAEKKEERKEEERREEAAAGLSALFG